MHAADKTRSSSGTKARVQNIRIACLTRISTDEINQPYSLDAQTNALDAFVAAQPGYVITHRFVDQASGATLKRPGLRSALASARAGEYDVLLVYRIDRLSRSVSCLMEIVAQLNSLDVALRSVTEPIDTRGPVGLMLLQLFGVFAEFERGVLIDRISKGFERKAARGEWLCGRAPFGYQLDSAAKSLVAERGEASVVQAIFSAYAEERLGAKAIAVRLNDDEVHNRSGRPWTNQAILHLLRNPVYAGKITHRDEIYNGKHDPIIDEDLFARTWALLLERSAQSMTSASKSVYSLSGKVRCQVCGGAFVGVGSNGRDGYYRYYICRVRHSSGANACAGARVPADDLEDAVAERLGELFSSFSTFEEAAKTAFDEWAAGRREIEDEVNRIDAEFNEATVAIDRHLRAFEAGTMPPEICAPRVEELSARRDELTIQRDQLIAELHRNPELPSQSEFDALAVEIGDVIAEKEPEGIRQLFDEFIDHVEISSEKIATAYFHVPDIQRPGPIVARVCDKSPMSIDEGVLDAPPKRDPAIKSADILLVTRKRTLPNCRDEVLEALRALVAESGDRPFPVREVYGHMRDLGTAYSEPTVYKAMQRMKSSDPRLPGIQLERVGRQGFRLTENLVANTRSVSQT
jgi:site-specific DNA recombinase